MRNPLTLTLAFALALSLLTPQQARAQYPEKPIKIITMSAPGAIIDLATRQMATLLSAELGQPIMVVNQPGAGGNVATSATLAAKPDGYTLCTTGVEPFSYNIFTLGVRYAYEDLTPISLLHETRMAVIALPEHGWKNMSDPFKQAKAENRALKAAIMDTRSRDILEYIAAKEGVKLAPIPQQGGAPTLTSVLGGHADIGIVGSVAVDNTLAGKIVTLASASDQRFTKLPDVSTLKEQGYDAVYNTSVVLFASSKVPQEIITKLEQALIKISASPEYQKTVVSDLNTETTTPGQAFAKALLQKEFDTAKAQTQAK